MKLKNITGVLYFINKNYYDGKSRINSDVLNKYKITLEKGSKLIGQLLKDEKYFNKIDSGIVAGLKSIVVIIERTLSAWNVIIKLFSSGQRYTEKLNYVELNKEIDSLNYLILKEEKTEFLLEIENIVKNLVLNRINEETAAISINNMRKVTMVNYKEGISFTITFEGDIVYSMPAALKGSFEERSHAKAVELNMSEKLAVRLAEIAKKNNPMGKNVIISGNRKVATKHKK